MGKFSRPENEFNRRYSKSTNMGVSCEKSFTAAHFDTLPRIQKNYLSMKFWVWSHLHVKYKCGNFQIQKIYKKKHIPSLPTCVVVRNKGESLPLLPTSTPFLGLSFCWYIMKFWPQHHLFVGNMWDRFQSQKMYIQKKLFHIYQCL